MSAVLFIGQSILVVKLTQMNKDSVISTKSLECGHLLVGDLFKTCLLQVFSTVVSSA